MLRGKDIQEIRYASPNAGRADTLFKAIITLAGALAMFELNRVSATIDRVEARQLTQMLPGLSRVEERLRTLDRFCCSEVYGDGKVHADVMLDDDPPKGKKK